MKMIPDHAVPNDNAGKAIWFALGLLGGAVVALLASPTSGRENRQMIKRGARQVSDYVTDEGGVFVAAQRRMVNQAVDRGREEVQAIGTRVNDAIAHGKSAYRAAREQFHDAATEAAASAANTANAVKDAVVERRPS